MLLEDATINDLFYEGSCDLLTVSDPRKDVDLMGASGKANSLVGSFNQV